MKWWWVNLGVCAALLCLSGCGQRSDKITVAMMPKSKGNAYFIACRQGAEKAARELGVDLLWDGPTSPDPVKQNDIIETGAKAVLSGDLGCLLNIAGKLSRRGGAIEVRHVAEVLAGMTEEAPPIGAPH